MRISDWSSDVCSSDLDYRKVTSETPILGAPLPGDLGGPILERQRQLGLEPGSTTGMTPAEQAAEAERQRIAAQARQAREAGVMIRSAGGSPAASIASALGSAPTLSAPDADETGRSDGDRVDLDPGRDQNNQQRKLDFLGPQRSTEHTYEHPSTTR